jgi:hypothetical protein
VTAGGGRATTTPSPASPALSQAELVSLRFYLASASDDPLNVEILSAHLGGHVAARTLVVQQLLEPRLAGRERVSAEGGLATTDSSPAVIR